MKAESPLVQRMIATRASFYPCAGGEQVPEEGGAVPSHFAFSRLSQLCIHPILPNQEASNFGQRYHSQLLVTAERVAEGEKAADGKW